MPARQRAPPVVRSMFKLLLVRHLPVLLCFPFSTAQRAREYLATIPGGVGAYSESKGAVVLRQHVAKVRLRWGWDCAGELPGAGSCGKGDGR